MRVSIIVMLVGFHIVVRRIDVDAANFAFELPTYRIQHVIVVSMHKRRHWAFSFQASDLRVQTEARRQVR